MKTFRMPNTDLDVSRIAYGCMKIGGSWERSEPLSASQRLQAMRSVHAALDEDINFFDHADIYCAGKSEEAFSGIWKESPGLRPKIILQSKCGIRFNGYPRPDDPARYDFSYEHIIGSVEGILRRLQTDYLDILLLHRPDALVEPEEVAKAFGELRAAGKVRYFGVSNHSAAQVAYLQSYLDQPLVANQVELSLIHNQLINEGVVFNQDEPEKALRGEGTLEYCRQHGVTLQAWGPLASGAVLDAQTETGKAVRYMAQVMGTTPEAVALGWLLRHPARIQAIIGTVQPERIRAACKADGMEFSREEWYRLFAAGRGAEVG